MMDPEISGGPVMGVSALLMAIPAERNRFPVIALLSERAIADVGGLDHSLHAAGGTRKRSDPRHIGKKTLSALVFRGFCHAEEVAGEGRESRAEKSG